MVAIANLTSLNRGDAVTIATTSSTMFQPTPVPTVHEFTSDIPELDKAKKVIMRTNNGDPILPISASDAELRDMYSELAMRVFMQDRKIKELEDRINQLLGIVNPLE